MRPYLNPDDAVDFDPASPNFEIHAHAAAFYVALLRGGMHDQAADFAEWYLEEFDHDLET